jgi:hypothetical protein
MAGGGRKARTNNVLKVRRKEKSSAVPVISPLL